MSDYQTVLGRQRMPLNCDICLLSLISKLKLVLSVDLGCVSQKTWKSGKQNSIFGVQKICDVIFFDSANR